MTRRSLSVLLLVVVIAGCGGSDDAKGPTATVGADTTVPSTTTTAEPATPEQQVEAAYLKSWDVYAKAKQDLTTEGLDCCYAGDQLKRTTADIQDRIDTNRPARVVVDHNYTIRIVSADTAVIVDNYVNHSVLVDPKSGEPIEAAPNDRNSDTFTLRKLDGQWKVTQITANAGG